MTGMLGQNLLRLRNAKNLTQDKLADDAGLALATYRTIEQDPEANPRLDTLEKIAEVLGVKVLDLFVEQRTLQNVRFRANKGMKKRGQILSSISLWLEAYNDLEEKLDVKQDYLFSDFKVKSRGKDTPIQAAAAARELLDLVEYEPIQNIGGLLEGCGIKIYLKEFGSDAFFGLSVGKEDGGPAIVVNTWERIPVERQIFSVAHEFGHLLLHHSAFDVAEEIEEPKEEEEANIFASHFLMPEAVFKELWEETVGLSFVDRVLKVKQYFHTSYAAVLYRLTQWYPEHKNEIWDGFYETYKLQYGKELGRTIEPSPFSSKPEPESFSNLLFEEDRLNKLVMEALGKDLLSIEEGARILEIEPLELRMKIEALNGFNLDLLLTV